MKKTYIIRFLKISALILPVFLFVLFSQQYLFYFSNHNAERIRRFYQEEQNSLDVVFLGASEVFSGFAPAAAYEEYGFTSYMYAMDSNPGALYQHQLKEVLKKQHPQYIFVEVNGFLYDRPAENHMVQIFTENIPMSFNKLETIWKFRTEDKLSGVFPFTIYHSDWTKVDELPERFAWRTSTAHTPSLLKGIVTSTAIDRQLPEEIELSGEQKESMQVAVALLDDFLQYCKENRLENIVFIRFPHKTAGMQSELIAQVEDRIQEFGYPFLNLEEHKDAMQLDPLQDYYNPEHLNIYGQKKLTRYLGKIIRDQFDIAPIVQSDANRLHWECCVDSYHQFYEFAHENITNQISLFASEDRTEITPFLDWLAHTDHT